MVHFRSEKTIEIEVGAECDVNEREKYVILAINKFTSERKRMSVIVRNQNTGKTFIFAKGAES